jgi:hypothetical protein
MNANKIISDSPLYRVQTVSGLHEDSCPVDFGSSFPGGKASRGTRLTTYLRLKPRVEVSGAISPFTLAEGAGEQCIENIWTEEG